MDRDRSGGEGLSMKRDWRDRSGGAGLRITVRVPLTIALTIAVTIAVPISLQPVTCANKASHDVSVCVSHTQGQPGKQTQEKGRETKARGRGSPLLYTEEVLYTH
jgi:hypothetical protein